MSDARCHFYVRFQVEGGYRFESVTLTVWDGSTNLPTSTPPLVGDLVHLWGNTDETRGTFRVVAREWLYPSFGSADWPHTAPSALKGPLVTIIVEPSEGLFADEVEGSADE